METPLFSALINHVKKSPLSLHVPGHKNGMIFSDRARDVYRDILQFDLTELTGLDDLHHAEGAILEAERLTAKLYGVKESKFLVNGSTVGNLAMIMASCNREDVVLVQRNSHKSIINGIQLAGAHPVFLTPKIDNDYGIPSYIELETIQEALKKYPNSKAIILTNPNYYGLAIDLTEIITLAHKYSIPVLVDEAHGAHFILGEPFPKSSITAGADIVVHSAHKTLPAMTMGSFLHFNSELVNKDKLYYYLSILQSSSPSYPIMASLDLARAYLKKVMENKKSDEWIKKINSLKGFLQSHVEFNIVQSNDPLVHTDPLKLTLQSTKGLTGHDLLHYFEEQNIFAELADPTKLLFILPLEQVETVLERFKSLKKQEVTGISEVVRNTKYMPKDHHMKKISPLEISYSSLVKYDKRLIPIQEAIGAISAESIIPYPPGIPLIMEGERITVSLLNQLRELIGLGISIQGDVHIKRGKILTYIEGR